MKEYGGYIELDELNGSEYYTDCLSLNSGRSCLGYLIENRNITKIYLPCFLCDTVKETCEKYKIAYEYYTITDDFKPVFTKELCEDEYLYVVNFYGQLSKEYTIELHKKYNNLILDKAQDFYREPIAGMDTIYICRKYFGVADGAYLFTKDNYEENYPIDTTYDRMLFLLGRYEKDASSFYSEYVSNNDYFANKPIMRTSKLTRNLLKAIEYEKCKEVRTKNFTFLHEELQELNELKLKMVDGPFAYPLLVENGAEIKKKLIEKKMYIPTLWPDVFNKCDPISVEYRYAKDILPLPVDQRYCIEDMLEIASSIKCLLK